MFNDCDRAVKEKSTKAIDSDGAAAVTVDDDDYNDDGDDDGLTT